MPKVTVYSRPECCLCNEVKQQLEALQAEHSFALEEINIDEDPSLRRLYNDQVPVVAIDGENVFRHRLKRQEFLQRLREAEKGRTT